MYCYADHVANTSARCTGVGWGGVGHANVMYGCVTCNTPRYAEKVATSEPSTEIAVRSESNEVQMGVLLYVETQRQV